MAEARISVGPGLLCSIKPSWSSKVSSYNEPRRHCTNIPQDAACILVADCGLVFAHVCSVCAHDRACSPCSCEEQGNRVTLRLIRKLMHRKSRQRHGSPSACSAGENNLHIGRLMDTFIGSTEREGWRGRGRAKHREERRGLIMAPDRCRTVTLLMRTSQIAAYQITHNHWGQ